MKSRTKSLAIAAALLAALAVQAPSSALPAGCVDADASVDVVGTAGLGLASGKYALPTSAPKALVVFAHGYRNRSDSWVDHLLTAARDHQVVAVAMDYTGTGPAPDNRGMPLIAGAQDTAAAAQHFSSACGLDDVFLFGVSMGGAVSGLALAEGPSGLFDYWVDVEGMNNITETYLEATAATPSSDYVRGAAEDIRAETSGGSPSELARRSVVTRAADIAASGLKGAVVVHAVGDGLVPYDQSVELVAALRSQAMTTDFFTVVRRSSSDTSGNTNGRIYNDFEDTTGPSYIPGSRPYFNELSGHGWEGSPTHTVIRTGFDRLWALVDGQAPVGLTVVLDKDEKLGS